MQTLDGKGTLVLGSQGDVMLYCRECEDRQQQFPILAISEKKDGNVRMTYMKHRGALLHVEETEDGFQIKVQCPTCGETVVVTLEEAKNALNNFT